MPQLVKNDMDNENYHFRHARGKNKKDFVFKNIDV
jgi:hypothetical protein